MVCGAPTPCSSGGRSAVSTKSGTKARRCFGHAGVEFRRGRTTRHHDGHGSLGHERSTEREESGTSLVNANVQRQLGAMSTGEGERRRARSGAQNDVTKTECDPLVEQRRGERRLDLARARYARLQCHSLVSNASVRVRRSSGCTASPRPRIRHISFRSILAGTSELLTLDLPGHGQNTSIRASLPATAELLADVLPEEPFVLGGYPRRARRTAFRVGSPGTLAGPHTARRDARHRGRR